MNIILTAKQAKQAREDTSLSQGKVATELQLNRTYLSLFESGKYVFDDNTLQSLRSYYEALGVVINNETMEVTDTEARLRDGFIIPHAIDDDEVEEFLAEYAENKSVITTLCADKPETGLFGGVVQEDVESRQYEIILLMARNFLLIEELQGHLTLMPSQAEENEQSENMAEYVRNLFSGFNRNSISVE